MTTSVRRWLPAIAASLLTIPAHRAHAQVRADSIRGRVTTDSGAVIPAADVIVTVAPTTNTVRATTDSAGRYALGIPGGTGEYILYIGAVGRKPFRTRLTRTGARDTTWVMDVKLASAVTQVAAVTVQARKDRPNASLPGEGFGTSGNDKSVDGVSGAVPPELATNVDALAAYIPGLAVGPGGISAFGMGSDANNTTLNGLNFGGGDLPRGARTATRFSTSPWDPTIGGAGGLNVRQSVSSGGNISARTVELVLDDPALQFSDPLARRIGREYSSINMDAGGSGAYALDALFYNYGVHVRRYTSDVSPLTSLDAATLGLAGVSRDSAAKLLQTLSALHIPVSAAGVAPRNTSTSASFIERIDHRLPTIPRTAVPFPTWSITAFGAYSSSDPQGLQLNSPTTSAGSNTSANGFLQGSYTKYFGKDGTYLNETTTAFSFSDNRGTPFLLLPGGNVLIASALADGTTGLGSLGFGGNGAFANENKTWGWEALNVSDFLGGGKANLPMKFSLQSRFDGFSLTPSANRLGFFGFPSLGALAAGQPSTFSRTLNAPSVSGTEWNGAAALGGTFTKGILTLTGGLRAEGNVYLNAPPENPAIESTFGARTDRAPNSVAILPRLGFVVRIPGSPGNSAYMSPVSTTFRGPSQIRGGIGAFRNTAPPTLLASAITNTGLPGGAQRLLCTGPATPVPQWQAYEADTSAIPASCVNTSTFADTAPSVTLFDRNWKPGESWRATLGYSKTLLATYLSIDANYSLNVNQRSSTDLNFAGTPRFSLGSEASRPVYVSPSSIDPGSGAVSTVQSRMSPAYGRVSNQLSDLHSDAKQIAIYAIPTFPFRFGTVTMGYTWAEARSQSRGFDASTGGDPRLIEWSQSVYAPRHTFFIQYGRPFGQTWGFTTVFRAQSGLPFTPLVGGDVNGDGSSNDRAFVFNPATASDPTVASGVRSLMASGPKAARDCLAAQVGRVAALNSCTGPWSATMIATIYMLRALPWTNKRATMSLSMVNLLGGIDELVHGNDNLKGWGMTPFPDQTLLRVRGFDPNANAFLYSVNPRFGSTSIATTSQRVPFRLTLDVKVDVGYSRDEQSLEQSLRMRPALVGTRAPVDSIKARYLGGSAGSNGYSDFYGFLLARMKDSLALSTDQMRKMQDEREVLRLKADKIYGALADYLVALPASYDAKAAVKKTTEASDAVWVEIMKEGPFLEKLLLPAQVRMLPSPILGMIKAPNSKSRFYFGF